MNVVIINKSDATGGAAVVSRRLMDALRTQGINACMLVAEKRTDSPHVHLIADRWRIRIPFLIDRLKIFLSRGVNKSNLFKIDTGADGLPLYKHPLVKNADVICLNWVNQGVLSLKGLKKMLQLGKPIVWTMHDMWCFTGICHHAGKCRNFEKKCGDCPLLGKSAKPHDLSYKILAKKEKTYQNIHFVAVSNWLADLARTSTLLRKKTLSVIPNAFPVPHSLSETTIHNSKPKILFGAARLDDPVKGLPILIEATRILKKNYPEISSGLQLITFGRVKNHDALNGIAVDHIHLGRVNGEEAVKNLYIDADIVVSTSLYETLPGTLVEGQVYGCVPVAFNRGGQPDIVRHMETGYLAEWNDDISVAALNIVEGIIWALNRDKKKIRSEMMKSAVSRFDAPVIAQKYISLFRELLANKKRISDSN